MPKWTELNNEVKMMVDGQYQFEKDKEAVRSYFVDFVNHNMVFFHTHKEKIEYLLENEYYDDELFNKYTLEEAIEVFEKVYSKKFRFESFMNAFKFYNNYALKTDDGERFLERYEDRVAVNALFLADGDFEKAKDLAEVLIGQCYQPATPTFLNAGRKRSGRLVSCFLLEVPDSTEGIGYVNNSASQLSRFGGGVAINLSKLRAHGEAIKGIENAAKGVVGVAKMLEQSFMYFDQMGQRSGAGAVYLNIFHADVMDFLSTKKINVDENYRLKTLSLGLIVPDKFYELAEKNEPYFTFYPYSVHKEYGMHLDDMQMDEWYDVLLNNPNIRKKKMISARKLLAQIAGTQIESGYPYLINVDNANKVHMLKDVGRIKMSNLCVEIMQLSKESDIQGYKGEDKFGKDISCNLGSINIVNVMEKKNIKKAVKLAVDALTTVTLKSAIDEVPTVKNANQSYHSIGLGAMNLHGYLAKNKILYGSENSKDFANTFFMMKRFYALERSMEIAKERGEVFEDFEKSEYAKGTALTKYLENDYSPKLDKVKALFEGIYIPTKEDWKRLNEQIMTYGLFHAYTLAIAPTQSISYVQNSTQSVLPIIEPIETRTYGDSTTHYPMPYISNENYFFYRSAYDMDMFKLIDLMAVIQEHVDQSISTTLYVDGGKITTRQLARYFVYAHKKGLKSLYYTRTKLASVAECNSCSV
ncbi:ribonucleotide-diphosphate reductase subunit alpha [Bacillus thuringiensis]|uniref:Ribonucleoside-diphosphate reductase n=2 Tax=Bacillus thuringiensis TaxID=1428 RepID=A0A9X6YIZ0_BACTU|nr:ribonucleotide-diphosphate reductase subunit alpha [Bacillus thuringiensis]PGO85140.1 ribonucleotide-diphosphate reductase subunit alpha [Bacillus thuringiensis]